MTRSVVWHSSILVTLALFFAATAAHAQHQGKNAVKQIDEEPLPEIAVLEDPDGVVDIGLAYDCEPVREFCDGEWSCTACPDCDVHDYPETDEDWGEVDDLLDEYESGNETLAGVVRALGIVNANNSQYYDSGTMVINAVDQFTWPDVESMRLSFVEVEDEKGEATVVAVIVADATDAYLLIGK